MPPREPAPTRLVLIRTANGERADGPARLIDHDDLGLSALGQHQVQALADRLASTGELAGATRLHCGSSNRARQTAVALAPTLGGLPVEASCGFCEPHSGSAEGRTVDDWLATDGQTRLEHWSPYAPKGPGGESVTIGMDRAARADRSRPRRRGRDDDHRGAHGADPGLIVVLSRTSLPRQSSRHRDHRDRDHRVGRRGLASRDRPTPCPAGASQ